MLKKLKAEIDQKREELKALEAELEAKTIRMKDIKPFAVFDIIPACNDFIALIPLPNGEFAMGGLYRDFKQFWCDKNHRNGQHSFTQQEMLEKLVNLNATKSKREILMTK